MLAKEVISIVLYMYSTKGVMYRGNNDNENQCL